MADGLYYVDSRSPFVSADLGPITVIGTNIAMVQPAAMPTLGAGYFGYIGKTVRIRMFGRWSTAAAAGTQTFNLYWGSGAAANGTIILSSQAITPINSLVNTSWRMELFVRCRALGSSGSLIANGSFSFLNSLTLTTPISEFLMPATANAAVTVDLTQNFVLSPQVLATTSTTNAMTVHDFLFEALN